MLHTEPVLAHRLLERITEATILYLRQKVAHGADLIQLFDSWAGIPGPRLYQTFAIPYLQRIVDALRPQVPVTLFSKGAWFALEDLAALQPHVIGLDWNHDPRAARARVGERIALQGNLDPTQLYAAPEVVAGATIDMLKAFGPRHIANLGHGVYPDTPLEGVRAFIGAVKDWKYQSAL
jgi:uroporphyrinogen decarboxylase